MRIYTPEECEQWIGYKEKRGWQTKKYLFEPTNENNKIILSTLVVDVTGKCFTHNLDIVKQIIEQLVKNYPLINEIYNDLKIFICPKPEIGFSNAMCWDKEIVLWGRTTQIPYFMTDYIIAHELGHSIQKHFCSEHRNKELFRKYLELRNAPRGMCKIYDHWDEEKEEAVYITKEDFLFMSGEVEDKELDWDKSPLEWFAEDFRYLFGVDKGEKYWGLEIEPPDDKVKEFILSLN